VVAKIVGTNVQGKSSYEETVSMYVHEEIVGGQKLSDIINLHHENTKYLPGCKLPANVVCCISLTITIVGIIYCATCCKTDGTL